MLTLKEGKGEERDWNKKEKEDDWAVKDRLKTEPPESELLMSRTLLHIKNMVFLSGLSCFKIEKW